MLIELLCKSEKFCNLLRQQQRAFYAKEYPELPLTDVRLIIGRKYTKVDVFSSQWSGKYMIDNDTGKIYGIKAYGVINKGHQLGTLDTIDQYYWGGYRATRIALPG
jgi:hypothetical protein